MIGSHVGALEFEAAELIEQFLIDTTHKLSLQSKFTKIQSIKNIYFNLMNMKSLTWHT